MFDSQTEHSSSSSPSFVHISSACVFNEFNQSVRLTDSLFCPYCIYGPDISPSVVRRKHDIISRSWENYSIIPQATVPYVIPFVEINYKSDHRTVLAESRFRCMLFDCLIPLLFILVNMTCLNAAPLMRIQRISPHQSIPFVPPSSAVIVQSNTVTMTTATLPTLEHTTADHRPNVISPNNPMNATHRVYLNWHNNSPLIKVYMRSQRTRRSLEYYMSNGDTAPMFIVSQNHDCLTISDDGIVSLVPRSVRKESKLRNNVV
ncbi:hypothetical protein FBUS_01920 [Fasciolopsis buskii]|uniref:Uncharacterized protein n=1 Tax=Fasciolopsis buskii TaxID=27845 RepID=A0A8E0VJA4_9TREM|nr:hypothetical protein FBUS_01920 [Fasciolopsis buski]